MSKCQYEKCRHNEATHCKVFKHEHDCIKRDILHQVFSSIGSMQTTVKGLYNMDMRKKKE